MIECLYYRDWGRIEAELYKARKSMAQKMDKFQDLVKAPRI